MKKLLFLILALNFANVRCFVEARTKELSSALNKLIMVKEIEPTVKDFVQLGADLNLVIESLGGTCLHDYAKNSNRVIYYRFVNKMVKTLIKYGADANCLNSEGLTALHVALANDAEDVANLLVDKTDILNTQDANGNTPLHFAVKWKQLFLKLLDKNADINIENFMQHNAITSYARVMWAGDKEVMAKIDSKIRETKKNIESNLDQVTLLPKVLTDLIIGSSFKG